MGNDLRNTLAKLQSREIKGTANTKNWFQKKNDGMAFHYHSTGPEKIIITGIEIKKHGENRANMQMGFEVDGYWKPIIEKLK